MNKFIFEIGTEEIPSVYIDNILKDLKNNTTNILGQLRIDYHNISTMGSPRRLIVIVDGIAPRQKDISHKIKGPSVTIAFDSQGKPQKPAIKFAQTNRIKLNELIIEKSSKGEYIFARKLIKGKKLGLLLPEICLSLINSINLPKSMRWGLSSMRFIRPIRWLLALYDNKIVHFKMDNLTSGRTTYGHRLLAPGPIKVNNVENYFDILKKRFVIIDPEIRKENIKNQIFQIIRGNNGKEHIEEELLDEVKNLVEFPKVLVGKFDKKYLDLPVEVLSSVMIKHQKYFPIFNKNGVLLPLFLVVINGNEDRFTKPITEGNERVLKARLEDAKFFYQEDQKITERGVKPLDSKRLKLKNVIFQENLGTVYDKVERISILSKRIAQELKISSNFIQILERSAQLCKSDLVTEMVKEFPELQGIMGREYALLQGEDSQVATTIYEHYLPRFSGDNYPKTITGSILSIADKLDNIVSCFINNIIPDGSQDPYALRRQALGIINIIMQHKIHFSIDQIIDLNINLFLTDKCETKPLNIKNRIGIQIVKDFILQRLRYLLLEKQYRYDIIDAVLAKNLNSIFDILNRITSIQRIYHTSNFLRTITAATRAYNLSKNISNLKIDANLLQEREEHILYNQYIKTKESVEKLMAKQYYDEIYACLETLNEVIDVFFDEVLVMVDDENLRNNRLALLKNIADLYFTVADLSKIALAKGTIRGD